MKKINFFIKTSCKISLVLLLLSASSALFAQNVGINTTGTTPNSAAILDLNTGNTFTSPNGMGLLVPNVALTGSADAITIALPPTSLLVYVPAGSGLTPAGYYYNAGTPGTPDWVLFNTGAPANSWLLLGNAGTSPGTNFLGTTDAEALEFKVDGQQSGWIDYTGNDNTFLGYQSGLVASANPGTQNVGVGYQSLLGNTSGIGNTAVGNLALTTNTSSSNNTAVGDIALKLNTGGASNSAFGEGAARSNTSGSENNAIGSATLALNTIGSANTADGWAALYNNIAGSNATAIGYQAMYYANNSAVAFNDNNVAVGYQALFGSATPANNTGIDNVALGYQALYSNTSGQTNTALGMYSLFSNSTANANTAVGYGTLFVNTTGGNNTALGAYAFQWNSSGANNTGGGAYSIFYNTTGSNNSVYGYYALRGNVLGNYNTAIGTNAMEGNAILTGTSNASQNTAIGGNALYNLGYLNGGVAWATDIVAIGYEALYLDNPTANNNGYQNTALGDYAGYNITTPADANVTGSDNTFIGYNAAPGTATQLTNATAVGANATVSTSNTITLGNNSVTATEFNGALMPYYGAAYNAGTAGQVLASQGPGVAPQWTAAGSGTVTGSGTVNYLARWTPNTTTLGIGVTQDNGATVGINAAPVGTQMLTVLQTNAANTAIVGKNSAVAGTNNGIGVFGISSQAYAAGPVNGYGVVAENNNTNGTGLFATGNNIGFINYLLAGSGAAIIGSNVGVFGWSNAATGVGVLGEASGANSTGIEGSGNNFTPNALAAGSGAAFTGGTVGCYAVANTGAGNTAFIGQEDGEQTYLSYWSGAIYYKTIATGAATNSCSVPDLNGNYVCMHAPETPECYFEDYGQGELTSGKAHINLDPVFAKNVTIDEKHPLRVYIQLEGDCKGVYVTNKTSTGFDVVELNGGTSNVSFQYHIICNMANVKMADGEIAKYSDARFEPAPKFQASHTDPNLKTTLPTLTISSK